MQPEHLQHAERELCLVRRPDGAERIHVMLNESIGRSTGGEEKCRVITDQSARQLGTLGPFIWVTLIWRIPSLWHIT